MLITPSQPIRSADIPKTFSWVSCFLTDIHCTLQLVHCYLNPVSRPFPIRPTFHFEVYLLQDEGENRLL